MISHGKAVIELQNGIILTIEDDDLMGDGIKIDAATSGDTNFDIGAAIIGQCQLRVDNTAGFYNQFDFSSAEVVIYIGGEDENTGFTEYKKQGIYTVDDASMTEATINLTCLDNMAKLDRPYYESTLTYPATLMQITQDACAVCGVEHDSNVFDNSDYIVQVRPSDDALTFRAILSYAAQIAGSYARCDPDGKFGYDWYNVSALMVSKDSGTFDTYNEDVYATGDNLDGGNLLDYASGDVYSAAMLEGMSNYHHVYDLSSQDLNASDVVVTGVQVSGTEKENKSYFDTTMFYNGLYDEIKNKVTKSLNAISFVLPIGTVMDGQCFMESELKKILFARQSYRLDFDAVGIPPPVNIDTSGSIVTMPVNTARVFAEADGGDDMVGDVTLEQGGGHYSIDFELTADHADPKTGKAYVYIDFYISNKAGQKVTLSNFSIQKTDAEEVVRSALCGEAGYVLSIADNPLVSAANVQAIADSVGAKIVNTRIRPLTISAVADPSINAGDIAYVSDRAGRAYPTIFTSISFAIGAFESFACGAETVGENSTTRYTEDTKTGVIVTEDTKKLITEYDTQIQKLFGLMVGIFGLFRTEEISRNETVEYIHNKPDLTDSTYIWKIAKSGFTVSQDGGQTYVNAIDSTGKAVLNAITIIGK